MDYDVLGTQAWDMMASMPSLLRQTVRQSTYDWLAYTRATAPRPLPYHNAGHCLRTAARAVKYGLDDNMDTDALTRVWLAGLWHDAGYSLSVGEDDNIETAVLHWQRYAQGSGVRAGLMASVSTLIRTTAYPYNTNRVFDAHNPEHVVLRDADLGEITEPIYAEVMRGLALEMQMRGAFDEDASYRDFAQANYEWWQTVGLPNTSARRHTQYRTAADRMLATAHLNS